MDDPPRFIADVMLGSLAKWLRIAGFDTLYDNRSDDLSLLRTAAQERRILLTRDSGIARRRTSSVVLLLRADALDGQLREVAAALDRLFPGWSGVPGQGRPLPGRCPRCNGELEPASRASVAASVPEHLLLRQDSFFRCRRCGKVYWEGSHTRMMDTRLRELLTPPDR